MPTRIEAFFRNNPVFSRAVFEQYLASCGQTNEHTLKNILAQHLQQGHIVRIKQGLFASIPYGADASTYPINPFLIVGHLTDDAVIAYHGALVFHGVAYSVTHRYLYLSQTKVRNLVFRGDDYQVVTFPEALNSSGQTHCYVDTVDVEGMDVKVTSKERTLVDVLDRPMLSGGWEEVWRSLEALEHLKINNIIDYTLRLANPVVTARVGFYLEQRKEIVHVTAAQFKKLEKYRPKTARHMDSRQKKNCKLIKRWNLLVPISLIERDWEENSEWES